MINLMISPGFFTSAGMEFHTMYLTISGLVQTHS